MQVKTQSHTFLQLNGFHWDITISMGMVQNGIIHRTNPVRRDGMRNTPSFVAPFFLRAEREKRGKKSWSHLSGSRWLCNRQYIHCRLLLKHHNHVVLSKAYQLQMHSSVFHQHPSLPTSFFSQTAPHGFCHSAVTGTGLVIPYLRFREQWRRSQWKRVARSLSLSLSLLP